LAKRVERFGQFGLDGCYFAPGESVIFPKLDRAVRAVQIEKRLTPPVRSHEHERGGGR